MTLADELIALGASSPALVLAAERGMIDQLVCLMPYCLCPQGRMHFENKKGRNFWAPSADRYPIPGRDGGLYTPDNVRLAHWRCNNVEGAAVGGKITGRALGLSNRGRKHTEDSRVANSAAQLGHKVSKQARAKISGAMLGSQHALGAKRSEATRAKMSSARKAWWIRKRAEQST